MRDGGAISFDLEGIRFDGFDEGFAERASSALKDGLTTGLNDPSIQQALVERADINIEHLSLDGLDFSTPDRLGQSLARAILHRVAER